MAFHGSPFQAEVKNGRITGRGKYTFADGNVYEGEFKDGSFHGQGTLLFTHGAKYEATWKYGIALEGRFTFADGLAYELEDWDYCTPVDRRLFPERIQGLQQRTDLQQFSASSGTGSKPGSAGYTKASIQSSQQPPLPAAQVSTQEDSPQPSPQ